MLIGFMLVLLLISVAAIKSGFLPVLFLTGLGIYLVIKSKKADEAIDVFFAFCFFGGILAMIYKAFS